MKNIFVFELDQAKKLVPIMGNTCVTVETDGEYEIINCKHTVYRGPRKVTLATTNCGELYRSPMGQNRSVRITLPAENCNLKEVKRQVERLFKEYYR
ncbi:MAG: hypothetical protein Q4E26_02395 [Prevotellaceae bacterium]|nr:hypothetical protein [Prevotellaceae bacterium]